MEEFRGPSQSNREYASSGISRRLNIDGYGRGSSLPGLKKRAHGSRSWIKINHDGNLTILELDKATIMKHCSLPSRDLRLLDPLFIYPSTILGREKAIVVSLEKIRCIITAEEVILMNSLDGSVVEYSSELCRRLQINKEHTDDLPFEFKGLELALELTCLSLDSQVKELEMEVYPVVDELASDVSTFNLERVRRLKGHLLTMTQQVQKVRDEIEQLMDDDGDMAEMYLTEKKERSNPLYDDVCNQSNICGQTTVISKSAPVSPVGSLNGFQKLQNVYSGTVGSKYGTSSSGAENIDQLEMLLEAYFVFVDHALSKVFSLKEYIDNTEDLINIKLGNVQNHLIQFELLLTCATFVATVFASTTAVFGMNFETNPVFDIFIQSGSAYHWGHRHVLVFLIFAIFKAPESSITLNCSAICASSDLLLALRHFCMYFFRQRSGYNVNSLYIHIWLISFELQLLVLVMFSKWYQNRVCTN